MLESIAANWVNGKDLASQKAAAMMLIKLHLSPGNAPTLAARANVDPDVLASIARKSIPGTALEPTEVSVYSRFDVIVGSMIEEAYQLSDQVYRNMTRGLAALVAVALAVTAGWTLHGIGFWPSQDLALSILVGLLATPLAPIAKDLSSALGTAVSTMQDVKKAV